MTWTEQLDKSTGSRPRAVLMMEGERADVAKRLTELIDCDGVEVRAGHAWMPQGRPVLRDGVWDKSPADEVRLSRSNALIDEAIQQTLQYWWLEVARGANVPNWDIASQCTVNGRDGLLLAEAKAHGGELAGATSGKTAPTTLNGWSNHQKIGRVIADAAAELQFATRKPWAISRDRCYQLSNRFAWAWKLASLGVPVVLVYLGFLDADEMPPPLFREQGAGEESWHEAVRSHAAGLVPEQVWNKADAIELDGVPLISLIRTFRQTFVPGGE